MPGLDPQVFLTPGAIGAAIETTVASIDSPTELNSLGTTQGELRVARTTQAGDSNETLYYLDTTSSAQDLPYIVTSATAGLMWMAMAGYAHAQALKLKAISTSTPASVIGNTNAYSEINNQNLSSGASASSDLVATADNGTSTTHYVDFGINGSAGGAAPFTTANAAYLYSTDNELDFAALGTSGVLNFYLGATPNRVGTFTSPTIATGAFSVKYTTDATSSTTGAINTSGGLGVAKAANIGTSLTVGNLTAGRIPIVSTAGLLADDTALTWDATNNCMSIGTSFTDSTTQANLRFEQTFTDTQCRAFSCRPTYTPAAGNANQSAGVGLQFTMNAAAGALTAAMANPNASIRGVVQASAGSVTAAAVVTALAQNASSGTVGDLMGFHVQAMTNSGGGTVTNARGIRVESPGVGTNRYGLDIDTVSGGSTNFAIRTNLGQVSIRDTTAASSSITGAVIIGNGSAATSVGIGSGAIYAGGIISTPTAFEISGTSGSFAAGRIYASASLGLVLGGKAGSTNDFYLSDPSGNSIAIVPTGTRSITFPGGVASTSTTTGTVMVGGGVGITGAMFVGGLITTSSTTLMASNVALTNGAGASVGTLTNAPAAGNPTKWAPVVDNGVTRYVPMW